MSEGTFSRVVAHILSEHAKKLKGGVYKFVLVHRIASFQAS